MLVAVASHGMQHVGSIRSCYFMHREEQDRFADQFRYRGDVAREAAVKTLLENDYFGDDDAILMLDGDQLHPPNLLDKLRAHDLDMVCAHYYRRTTSPIQSLCYELGDGTWPVQPILFPPRGGLHEISVTGFGCVLVKKKVLRDVQATLPPGSSPVAIGPLPEVVGDHANWGPDFIFFYRARKLGYKLWLDASVESLHAVTLWLGHKSADMLMDYGVWANACHELLMTRLELHGVSLEAFRQRKRILEARHMELIKKAEAMQAAKNMGEEIDLQQEYELSVGIIKIEGKMLEMDAWIEWAEKYPKVERPDQLPTTENTPKQETIQDVVPDEDEAKSKRQDVYRDQAIELAEMLPDVENKYGRLDGVE